MSEKVVYLNFPITLIRGFMYTSKECLNNIMDYAIYSHAEKNYYLSQGSGQQKELADFKDSSSFFGIKLGDLKSSYENGKKLYYAECGKPKAGISKDVCFDYYQNEKTDFEKACLLAFLALKSIMGKKPYYKCTNAYLLSRMAGDVGTRLCLPDEIKLFSTEYQLRKIITELRLNWGLVYYSRYTRGFYVSFQMALKDLILQAEKNRASTKRNKLREEENEALRQVKNMMK